MYVVYEMVFLKLANFLDFFKHKSGIQREERIGHDEVWSQLSAGVVGKLHHTTATCNILTFPDVPI